MPSPLTLDDTLDTRREVWHLLHRLPPRDRVRYLSATCRRCAPDRAGRLPAPLVTTMQTTLDQAYRCDRADDRLTNEVYADLLQLGWKWKVDLGAVACELEQLVRRRR